MDINIAYKYHAYEYNLTSVTYSKYKYNNYDTIINLINTYTYM